jgi:acetylornithine deacetylase
MSAQINIEKLQLLQNEAKQLLKELIATPSFSKEEASTASIIEAYLTKQGVKANRIQNNIWATNLHFDESKPSILLKLTP